MADVRALVPAVVEAATRAPSVHNTQPWRFVAHDDVVELWDDPARGLPVLDPVGRARLISCGAALALAEVAAAGLGVSTRTTLLPDAAAPDHLADLQLGAPHDPGRLAAGAGGRDRAPAHRARRLRRVDSTCRPRRCAPWPTRCRATAAGCGSSSRPTTRPR